jgi:chemotaxis protein methyltransferase CheR
LNPTVLAAFNEGIYNHDCFRATPSHVQRRYFRKADRERMMPIPELRRMISIKRVNIMDEFAFPRPFDFIFCRNMLIYFDQESRQHAMARLLSNLKPGGLLFLGHTEAVLDPPPGLTRAGNAIYRFSGTRG